MSVAPAHRTHDSDSTFVPDLGAEVGQVMLVQDAMPRSPDEQHFTDDRCATCRRSSKVTFGTPVLQTAAQLLRGTSRLRRFKCYPWPACGARSHTRST